MPNPWRNFSRAPPLKFTRVTCVQALMVTSSYDVYSTYHAIQNQELKFIIVERCLGTLLVHRPYVTGYCARPSGILVAITGKCQQHSLFVEQSTKSEGNVIRSVELQRLFPDRQRWLLHAAQYDDVTYASLHTLHAIVPLSYPRQLSRWPTVRMRHRYQRPPVFLIANLLYWFPLSYLEPELGRFDRKLSLYLQRTLYSTSVGLAENLRKNFGSQHPAGKLQNDGKPINHNTTNHWE